MLDALRDWLMSLIGVAFSGFDDALASAAEVLNGGSADIWDSMVLLSDVLKPFCYTVIAICILIELAQTAAKVDIIKWEHGLKLAVKMVLAKVCIDIAPTFLKACYQQAQDWIGSLVENSDTLGETVITEIEPLVNEVEGFGEILGMFLAVFIVILAVQVCGLIIQVIAYGRMFELYVYLVISPLPCAFMPLGDGGGINRITQKFFKSFIAIALQGVMMMIVMRVFGLIMSGTISAKVTEVVANGVDANTAVAELAFAMLLGSIALVMSVVKSGSWAKSILDAA